MGIESVEVHTAVVVRTQTVGDGTWIEGEPDTEPVEGTPFPCVLFVPQGSETPEKFRPRQVTRPTLLYDGSDVAGQPVALGGDDEIRVTAAQEPEPARSLIEGRWMVDGNPRPLGAPGDEPVVWMATLSRIDE